MSKKKKEKKEKVIYYDDNSTLVDMTNVTRTGKPKPQKETKQNQYIEPVTTSKWQTYWSAVRMMLFPMFVVLGILAVLFLFLLLITGNLF